MTITQDALFRTCYDILGEVGMERPPYEDWLREVTDNAEIWPIGVGPNRETLVGFVLFKGHSVHVAVKPEWHGRWIRPSLLKIWRTQYSHDCDLYATPDRFNKPACELAERLGFRRQSSLGQSIIYVKEATCLQPC